jgi:broad specificity phosphatase PhoE
VARRLYLVRHGQTESSRRKAYSGRSDVALTEDGREQARLVAAKLADAGIDAVFSSPLSRARDTAQAIAGATGAPLTIDERLTEVDYGGFEGLDRAAASERFGAAFDGWRADPFGSPVPGMEPLADALKRARAATAEAIEACELPVIVGHQGILRIVLIALGELEPEAYFSLRLREAEPVVVEAPVIADL